MSYKILKPMVAISVLFLSSLVTAAVTLIIKVDNTVNGDVHFYGGSTHPMSVFPMQTSATTLSAGKHLTIEMDQVTDLPNYINIKANDGKALNYQVFAGGPDSKPVKDTAEVVVTISERANKLYAETEFTFGAMDVPVLVVMADVVRAAFTAFDA